MEPGNDYTESEERGMILGSYEKEDEKYNNYACSLSEMWHYLK